MDNVRYNFGLGYDSLPTDTVLDTRILFSFFFIVSFASPRDYSGENGDIITVGLTRTEPFTEPIFLSKLVLSYSLYTFTLFWNESIL